MDKRLKIKWNDGFQILSQILLQISFCLIIIIALFYKSVYFHQISGVFNLEVENNFLRPAIIGSVFILISVIFVISFNATKWILIAVDILVSITILADIMYSKYYYNPITLTVVFYQFKFLGDIKDSATSLFNLNDLKLFIDIPFLILMGIFIRECKGIKWWVPKIVLAVVLFFTGQYYFNIAYSEADISTYAWEKKNMARDLGILYYHYDDIKNTTKKLVVSSKNLTNDEKNQIEQYKYIKVKNEYTGIDKNKNLVIIQLEAFQDFVINAQIEGQEITPNLNKLIKESIYCNNLYFQANYGNTSDAEFIANTSLYPSKTGAVYYEYPSNYYESAARVLNEQDYYTAALHGYKADFWNRTEMYRGLGFQRYYSENDFNYQKKIGFGISDEEFFKQSIDYLINDSNGKPFYGFLVSLSSHHPYYYFGDSQLYVGEYEGTMLGNFFKAANYADYALGQLFDYMKQKGIYDNTLIAIYGDHAALFTDEADNLCKYLDIEYDSIDWSKIQKVPFIVHSPQINQGIEIDKPAGQIDMLPTIANLMDIDIPYMYGRDLLNDEYGYAILPRGNVITEKFIFLIDEHNFYDINTKQQLKETDERVEEVRHYYNKKNVSSTILERNALKKLIK